MLYILYTPLARGGYPPGGVGGGGTPPVWGGRFHRPTDFLANFRLKRGGRGVKPPYPPGDPPSPGGEGGVPPRPGLAGGEGGVPGGPPPGDPLGGPPGSPPPLEGGSPGGLKRGPRASGQNSLFRQTRSLTVARREPYGGPGHPWSGGVPPWGKTYRLRPIIHIPSFSSAICIFLHFLLEGLFFPPYLPG